jgi:hypothetical protein
MTTRRPARFALTILSILIAGTAMTAYLMKNNLTAEEPHAPDARKVLLIGASVGKAWNLPEWPGRVDDKRFRLESIAVYQYDKSEALDEVLMRPKRKFRLTRTYLKGFFKPAPQLPDTIILKECAAYFPGDLERYKTLMAGWVNQVREANIEPVVATIVPVTREHQTTHPGRIEGIRAYNDWIRGYAAQERLPLLDLEAALRTDDTARFLSDDLTNGDGMHLNRKAYDRLDHLLHETLADAADGRAAGADDGLSGTAAPPSGGAQTAMGTVQPRRRAPA